MIILTGGLGAWNLVTEYSNLGGKVDKSFNAHGTILANVKGISKAEKTFKAPMFGMDQS